MVQLANRFLSVVISPQGAELTRISSRDGAVDYLWEGDPAVWKRHAPILFPIVGRLKNDRYVYEGVEYEMTQHGFARDLEFQVLERSGRDGQRVTMELTESDQTLAMYPFRFVLRVSYHLDDRVLETGYLVRNPADVPMYFSLGAHPAFRCPIDENETFSDHAIVFERPESAHRYYLEDGLIASREDVFLNSTHVLPLAPALFERDALVFKDLVSKRVSLRNGFGSHRVAVEFPAFPYLGLWTKPGSECFICIEPWHGLADSIDADGDLTRKEGILRLEPGQTFQCAMRMRFA